MQKAKFFIIGLAGLLAILVFINLQTYTLKKSLERERDSLKKENESLTRRSDEVSQHARQLKNKIDLLDQDLARVNKEREGAQKKLETVESERNDLVGQVKKLKEKNARIVVQQPPLEAAVAPQQPQEDQSYWAGVLEEKARLEMQIDNILSELRNIKIDNEQLQRDKAALDAELANSNREKEDLNRQIDYNRKMVNNFSSELAIEKSDKFQVQENIKLIKGENLALRKQLKNLDNQKINLERKTADLLSRNAGLEKRIEEAGVFLKTKGVELDTLKQELEGKQVEAAISGSKGGAVELPPIVVRPKTDIMPAGGVPTTGKVLAINKENNFIIIDLGEDVGVRSGDILQVYKDSKPIATLEVIQTRQTISACDIRKESAAISIGDTIKR